MARNPLLARARALFAAAVASISGANAATPPRSPGGWHGLARNGQASRHKNAYARRQAAKERNQQRHRAAVKAVGGTKRGER